MCVWLYWWPCIQQHVPKVKWLTKFFQEQVVKIYFEDAMNFGSDGGNKSLHFSTNKDWTIYVANTVNGSRWCTVSEQADRLVIFRYRYMWRLMKVMMTGMWC